MIERQAGHRSWICYTRQNMLVFAIFTVRIFPAEYSCASKSQIRKFGKQSSGTRKSPYLCLNHFLISMGIFVAVRSSLYKYSHRNMIWIAQKNILKVISKSPDSWWKTVWNIHPAQSYKSWKICSWIWHRWLRSKFPWTGCLSGSVEIHRFHSTKLYNLPFMAAPFFTAGFRAAKRACFTAGSKAVFMDVVFGRMVFVILQLQRLYQPQWNQHTDSILKAAHIRNVGITVIDCCRTCHIIIYYLSQPFG